METSKNDDSIKAGIGEAGIQQGGAAGLTVRPLAAVRADGLIGDIQTRDLGTSRDEVAGDLSADAHRVQDAPAGKLDILEHRVVEEALPVDLTPLVTVASFVVGQDPVVVGTLPSFGPVHAMFR